MLAALTAFVAAPLYRPLPPAAPPDPAAPLRARRDALLQSLRELELDRRTGAVEEDEYGRWRERLEAEAAEVLRQLGD